MINIFLSKKLIALTAIFLGGLLIAAGVLVFFGFSAFEPIAAAKSSQWTQMTGAGISVPACASSSPPPSAIATCNGGTPFVTFIWSVEGPAPDSTVCSTASITAGPSGGPQPVIATGQPCTGGIFDWSGATLFNTEYTYSINFENGGHVISSGTFRTPGYCSPLPPPVPPPTVSCSVAPISATTADTVTWTAVPSGGEAGPASGSTSQTFESGSAYSIWMTSGQDQTISARRFQATASYWLKKVSLELSREATMTGRVRVTIESDAGGLPSGSAIVGGTSDLINVISVCIWTCLNWIDFTLPGVELTAGTNYWIVLRGYFDSINAWSIIHEGSLLPDSNPGSKSLVRGYLSPSVWTDISALGADLRYRTYAATAPPSYSYSWAGSTPLLDSQTVNPVNISYSGTGDKFGNVTVTSGQTSEPAACSNSVIVSSSPLPTVDIKANGSNGPLIIPWNTAATLSWTSTDVDLGPPDDNCTASGAWSGPRPASGSESTGNITVFPSTYTMTCTGPGGTSAPDSVTINQSTPTLTINSFNAVPSSGDIPLNVNFDAQTTFTGNPVETIKYTLWWDCSYAGNSVADTINPALGNCGNPANPSIGTELLLSAPAVHSWPPPTVTHIYVNSGLKTVKLIVERGSGSNQAIPVWTPRVINVTISPLAGLSCDVNPKTARTGDNVTWSATWSGGQPDYTVIWSGDAPLPRTLTTSVSSSSVTVQYTEPGGYDGSVMVQSLDDGDVIQTQGPVTCLSTVKVAPRFKIR